MQDASVQEATQQEVVRRQQKALGEIAEKYASGKGGVEESVNAPTGNAYLLMDKNKKNEAKAKKIKQQEREQQDQEKEKSGRENQDPNSDDEDNGGFDDNVELRNIREARLKQIKNQAREKMENVGKGHGSYREIVQDDFLKEVTSSERVICHFYHRDFERCKIMDMHLQRLAARHTETKFVKIDAEKTPFFTAKLIIQTIPTCVCFFDGVGAQKIIGFDGLMDTMPEGKEDEWPTITLARLLGSTGIIDNEKIVDDDGIEAAHKARMDALRNSVFSGTRADNLDKAMAFVEEEDDFDLDNIEDIDFEA